MIIYLVTREGQAAILEKPALSEGPVASHFEVVTYEDALRRRDWTEGTVIFSDVERFWPSQFQPYTDLWRRLREAQPACHTLNHPTRTLRRYGLLRKLHAAGINSFNVYRADEQRTSIRFPVFLHGERDHNGPLSPLLPDQGALDRTLARLADAGTDLSLVLITEFCDVRDPDGLYRKYGAYVVGDRIIPRHLYFSSQWVVKDFRDRESSPVPDDVMFAEELDYLASNPHEAALRDICRMVGIEYGRIDYSVHNGRFEIWEMNTNPLNMSSQVPPGTPRYEEIWRPFSDRLHAALMAMPGAASDRPCRIGGGEIPSGNGADAPSGKRSWLRRLGER